MSLQQKTKTGLEIGVGLATGLSLAYGLYTLIIKPKLQNQSSSSTEQPQATQSGPAITGPATTNEGGSSTEESSTPNTYTNTLPTTAPAVSKAPAVTPAPAAPPATTSPPAAASPAAITPNTYAVESIPINTTVPISAVTAETGPEFGVTTEAGTPPPGYISVYNGSTDTYENIKVSNPAALPPAPQNVVPASEPPVAEYAATNLIGQVEAANTIEGQALTKEAASGFSIPGTTGAQPLTPALVTAEKGLVATSEPQAEFNPGESSAPVLNASVLASEGELNGSLTAEELLGEGNVENFSPVVSNTYVPQYTPQPNH